MSPDILYRNTKVKSEGSYTVELKSCAAHLQFSLFLRFLYGMCNHCNTKGVLKNLPSAWNGCSKTVPLFGELFLTKDQTDTLPTPQLAFVSGISATQHC